MHTTRSEKAAKLSIIGTLAGVAALVANEVGGTSTAAQEHAGPHAVCDVAAAWADVGLRDLREAAGDVARLIPQAHDALLESRPLDGTFCEQLARAVSEHELGSSTLKAALSTLRDQPSCEKLNPGRSLLLRLAPDPGGSVGDQARRLVGSCPRSPTTPRECRYLEALKRLYPDTIRASELYRDFVDAILKLEVPAGIEPAKFFELAAAELKNLRVAAELFRDGHKRAMEMDVPPSLEAAHKAWLRDSEKDGEAASHLLQGLDSRDIRELREGLALRRLNVGVHNEVMDLFYKTRAWSCPIEERGSRRG